jgi:PAS domain S-box-containing protein
MLQVLVQAPLAIIITDDQARIRYINTQAESSFGYKLDEMQGQPIEALIPEQFHNTHPKQRKTFTEQPHMRLMGIGLDLVGRRKNGEEFPVEIGLSHVRLADALHIVCYITDISQRKEMEKQLVSSEARFRNLINAAPDAVIVINQDGLISQVNQIGEELLGYAQAELVGAPIESLVPEKYRQGHLAQRLEYLSAPSLRKMAPDLIVEALRKDGTTLRVEIALSPVSIDGEHMVIAIVRDITDRVQMERQINLLAQIVQQMKDAVILTDSDAESSVRYVNKAFTDLYGYTEAEIIGQSSWDLFGGDSATRTDIQQKRDELIWFRDENRDEYQGRKKDGSLFWVSNTASLIHLSADEEPYDLGIMRDVSQQVHDREALDKKNAFLAALHETSLDILSRLELNTVLESLIGKASALLDCSHGLVYLVDPVQEAIQCQVGVGLFRPFVGSQLKKGEGLVGKIWKTGQPEICVDPHAEMSCPGYHIPEEIRCALGVPLRSGNEFIGVLCVADDHTSAKEFGTDEMGMLTYFSQLASIAIQNARLFSQTQHALQVTENQKARMDQELGIARSVQHALLPHELPELKDWSFAATWKPALEVAGDFYDVIVREDGYFDLVVADVTGKGVPAALFMAYSKSVLNMCLSSTSSLLDGINLANRLLVQKNVGPFATAFVARIHAETGRMEYVNAGHPPALVYASKTDEIKELAYTGMPLGISTEQSYQKHSLQLGKNDFLVLYTDGIIEAMDETFNMFGYDCLLKAVHRHRTCSVDEIVQRLMEEVDAFNTLSTPSDDIAIVVAKKL